MRIGIFGGSFDPPHIAHLLASFYCLSLAKLDEVWFVPVFKHAFRKPLSSFEDRFTMCRLLVERFHEFIRVSDIEKEEGDISYTIDTVRYLKHKFPHDEFVLLLGTDVLMDKDKWKDFDSLEEMAEIFEIPRKALEDGKEHFYLPDISSTEIRERIRSGQHISGLVSEAVEIYIFEKKLYLNEKK